MRARLGAFFRRHHFIKWGVIAVSLLLGLVGLEAVRLYAEVEGLPGGECIDTTEESWCAQTDAYRKRWRAIDCDYVPDCGPNAAWRARDAERNAENEAWLKCDARKGEWDSTNKTCSQQ